ncbi:MAG: hypothetical protein OXC01_17085 [Immundisolibacterales bacterium]|nr:hypothetical protein [Immundisolibacterales bacterium]
MSPPLLSLRGVSREFRFADRLVRAANDISFDIAAGECLAVVGGFDEASASGKRIVVAPDRAGTCARWRLVRRILPGGAGGERARSHEGGGSGESGERNRPHHSGSP